MRGLVSTFAISTLAMFSCFSLAESIPCTGYYYSPNGDGKVELMKATGNLEYIVEDGVENPLNVQIKLNPNRSPTHELHISNCNGNINEPMFSENCESIDLPKAPIELRPMFTLITVPVVRNVPLIEFYLSHSVRPSRLPDRIIILEGQNGVRIGNLFCGEKFTEDLTIIPKTH